MKLPGLDFVRVWSGGVGEHGDEGKMKKSLYCTNTREREVRECELICRIDQPKGEGKGKRGGEGGLAFFFRFW